jgi:hypothetical protein
MHRCALVAVLITLPVTATAQYGHPLKGSWSGERMAGAQSLRLLLNLDWDGKEVTGVINPGPNAATIRKVAVDSSKPSAWVVRLEAERKDASGKVVPIVIDGTLENIGAYRRFITGTWTEGGMKGGFKLTRN